MHVDTQTFYCIINITRPSYGVYDGSSSGYVSNMQGLLGERSTVPRLCERASVPQAGVSFKSKTLISNVADLINLFKLLVFCELSTVVIDN